MLLTGEYLPDAQPFSRKHRPLLLMGASFPGFPKRGVLQPGPVMATLLKDTFINENHTLRLYTLSASEMPFETNMLRTQDPERRDSLMKNKAREASH